MDKIGFIGAGNMGFEMIKGLVKQDLGHRVIYTDISEQRRQFVFETTKIPFAESNKDVVENSKYIILAIKPQNYTEVMEEIRDYITKDKIIISIAPGFTINLIKGNIGQDIRVIRSMPNTPAAVGEGMTVISFSKDDFSYEETQYIKEIFEMLGEVEVLEEKYMNAVVPISGSSPAYVYLMIEAMADAGVLTGLPRKLSYKLASQAVLGAAKMVLDTKRQPGELKDDVCSPGGTTIEAIASLESNNFRGTIIEAMKACFEKTKAMEA